MKMSEAQCVDEYELVSNVSYLHSHQAGSSKRSSVISLSQHGAADTTIKGAVHSETTYKDEMLMHQKQLMEKTPLFSETSSVNLMTVPKQITEHLKEIIQGSTFHPNQLPEKVLPVAKLELAFLLSKECVSFWNKYNTGLENTKDSSQENTVFIAIQVAKPFTSYVYLYIETSFKLYKNVK